VKKRNNLIQGNPLVLTTAGPAIWKTQKPNKNAILKNEFPKEDNL